MSKRTTHARRMQAQRNDSFLLFLPRLQVAWKTAYDAALADGKTIEDAKQIETTRRLRRRV